VHDWSVQVEWHWIVVHETRGRIRRMRRTVRVRVCFEIMLKLNIDE